MSDPVEAPIYGTHNARRNVRATLERCARLSLAFDLDPTEDHLQELELNLKIANGQMARLRRTHHLERGRQQALGAQGGRGLTHPDGPIPPRGAA
jgi:hypothetical protein